MFLNSNAMYQYANVHEKDIQANMPRFTAQQID